MQLNGTITFLSTYELKIVNQNLSESITAPVLMLVFELNYHLRQKKSTNVIKCAIKNNIKKNNNKTLQLCHYKNKTPKNICRC